jgi:hypothetical protein
VLKRDGKDSSGERMDLRCDRTPLSSHITSLDPDFASNAHDFGSFIRPPKMVCHKDFLPFTGKTMRGRVRNAHDHGVDASTLPIRSSSRTGSAARVREITAIAILAALAMALAWFLVTRDMRSDLSALRPLRRTTDLPTILIGWPELRELPESSEWEHSLARSDTRDRMLGYMMEGSVQVSEGKETNTFVLMPKAGQILRAASRNADDGVEVRLRRPARFSNRELVWVSGRIEHVARAYGDPSAPSYVMTDSEVSAAEQREITRWFTP